MKTQAEYLKSHNHCPWCNSEKLNWGDLDSLESYIFQKMMCLDCELEWDTEYKIHRYELFNS